MIDSGELTSMRATMEASLPDTATIQRATRASDGGGGAALTWATLSTVACRVSPSGRLPEERAIADRLSSLSLWAVTLPEGTTLAARDRLVIGSRTLEVVALLAPRSWELCRRVVCSEVA